MRRMSDSPLEDGWTRGERPENVVAIALRISPEAPAYGRSFTMHNDMPFCAWIVPSPRYAPSR
jgi:hypothetical protein